jgi:cell division septal protein FtsQ
MGKAFRKQRKIKKKQSFLKSRSFLFGVAVVLFVELLFYGIALLPFIQIQKVHVRGNEGVSESNIQSVVLDRLWGKFLFFPTASILLVDTLGIRDALLEAIPELESVNIQRRFPGTLVVTVQERRTAALWCQELSCVAVDKEGVAFKKADPSSGDIKIYGQAQSLNLKETAVKKDVLDAILYFAKEAKRRSLFLPDELSFEIVSENQIHARTGEGWSVYFTHTQDLSWQITKFQTMLENKIPPEKRRKLEYIDVRFGDQAYFKYR